MVKQKPYITLSPNVLKWARQRVGLNQEELSRKLKTEINMVSEWEISGKITVPMADALAKRTYTPVGYLYLDEPPNDALPIMDFRTKGNVTLQRPSPNLLETIYQMQRRQMWMREELIYQGYPPLDFVGAFSLNDSFEKVAAAMNQALHLAEGWAAVEGNWTNALRILRNRIEDAGVLVVFNGVVDNNTSRKLDRDEFQGFALEDEYAPLIFVNNTDYKTAQIFTLAHELAHIFVGQPGLSKLETLEWRDHETERVCNRIAGEFLVSKEQLLKEWPIAKKEFDPYRYIARHFKVSTIVAAKGALDAGLISRAIFSDYYEKQKNRTLTGNPLDNSNDGGDFWNNQPWRVGARFGLAVIRAVKEGRLAYREAYRLTGLKGATFDNMPEKMGLSLR